MMVPNRRWQNDRGLQTMGTYWDLARHTLCLHDCRSDTIGRYCLEQKDPLPSLTGAMFWS